MTMMMTVTTTMMTTTLTTTTTTLLILVMTVTNTVKNLFPHQQNESLGEELLPGALRKNDFHLTVFSHELLNRFDMQSLNFKF